MTDSLAHAAVCARAEPAEDGRGDGHQRKDGERGDCEPPVEHEQDRSRSDEDERVLDEARDPVGDELIERIDMTNSNLPNLPRRRVSFYSDRFLSEQS